MLNKLMFLLLISSAPAHAADDCLDWFVESGVQPISKDCLIKCNLIGTDMSSFMCPNRCDEFCKPPSKCKPDPFWLRKVKDGRPTAWPNQSEVGAPWSKEEKDKLLAALGQLPDELKDKNLKGIYRMKKSIQFVNPGTEIDGSIALYDYAFNGPFNLGRVLAHELAHSWYNSTTLSRRAKYQKAAGWAQDKISKKFLSPVGRAFVNQDAKESPEEDFAHNLDTYLFQPESLQEAAPKVFSWVKSNFSKNFALRTGCKDGN